MEGQLLRQRMTPEHTAWGRAPQWPEQLRPDRTVVELGSHSRELKAVMCTQHRSLPEAEVWMRWGRPAGGLVLEQGGIRRCSVVVVSLVGLAVLGVAGTVNMKIH